MAKYRIVKVTKFNAQTKYVIQKKSLFKWKQAYYEEAPFTMKAVTDTMESALELLSTKFGVFKTTEVVLET